jgi:acetyl esterase/lipase
MSWRCGRCLTRSDGILGGHQAYFGGDEATMLDASIPRIVTSGEAGMGEDLPALLVIQPGMDSNVPQDMTFDLLHAYQSRDGHIEYAFYPGQPHGFGARESEASTDMIRLVADFIRRRTEAE